MTLAFAARYRLGPVLLGITVASAVVIGISGLVGAAIGDALPTDTVSVLAGLAFVGVGVWTARGEDEGDEEATVVRGSRSTVLAVGGAFFLAELGDKTMLA